MKLLGDVAKVIRQDVIRDNWNETGRECAVQTFVSEFCDSTPENIALIGDGTTTPGEYKVVAFPIQSLFRRGRFCELPDDIDWFDDAQEGNLELVATWALTIEHAAGTTAWTNGAGVQTVALATTPTIDQRIAAIAAGRRQWVKSVSSRTKKNGPVLHVPPSLAPMLKTNGVIDSVDKTIWGDRVVTGDGYDEHPQVFWTGDITIYLSNRTTTELPHTRTNDEELTSEQVMAISLPPCSIVRVGAYA